MIFFRMDVLMIMLVNRTNGYAQMDVDFASIMRVLSRLTSM
jgi:hypothetical protein